MRSTELITIDESCDAMFTVVAGGVVEIKTTLIEKLSLCCSKMTGR